MSRASLPTGSPTCWRMHRKTIEPKRRSSASAIVLPLFFFPILFSSAKHSRGLDLSPDCTAYKVASCALDRTRGDAQNLLCHVGDGRAGECKFDASEIQVCPLAAEGAASCHELQRAAGSFVEDSNVGRRASRACGKSHEEHVQLPTCAKACCRADLPGAFSIDGQKHQFPRLQFQPYNSSCRFWEYEWRQAERCLAGSRIVIAGDSLMRQFFNSLVSLFRGQTTAMDYNKHAHARYMVCRTADKLTFGTFQPQRWEIPLEEITELYSSLNEGDLPACSNKPILEVDFLWSPRHMDLIPNLNEYNSKIASALEEGQLIYITFAGFWEDQSHVPPEYLEVLDSIRQRAKLLIVMGVPTARLYGWPKENTLIRNKLMQQWASDRAESNSGGNVLYLDFDHLSLTENAPQGIGSSNWHYQCFLDHQHIEEAQEVMGNLDGVWHWKESPSHLYPTIWTDDEGKCTDEMDAMLWQIVLNLICNKRKQEDFWSSHSNS